MNIGKLCAAFPALTALMLTAPAAADSVKIGILNDQSGVFSDYTGIGSLVAARMAVQDFGETAAGKPIEIIAADHQNKPDVGSVTARQWFDEEGVDAVADLGNSAVALSVNEIARDKNKVILVSGGGTTSLTGPSCSPGTVHWTYDTHSGAAPLAETLVKQGKTDWFFITADYTFGTSLQEEATRALEALGGTVVGSVRHPIGTTDYASYLLQAQASGADVIALANGGSDTSQSIQQANEFGITQTQTISALSMLITDIHGVGLEATQGLLLSLPFYWDLNEATRSFSRRFSERHEGLKPTMMQAGVYGAVLHYLKAVDALGSEEDGTAVVRKMKEMPAEDPLFGEGTIRIDGRKLHDVYVFQVKSPGESRGDWDYMKVVETIPGERAFLPPSEACRLVSGQ